MIKNVRNEKLYDIIFLDYQKNEIESIQRFERNIMLARKHANMLLSEHRGNAKYVQVFIAYRIDESKISSIFLKRQLKRKQ